MAAVTAAAVAEGQWAVAVMGAVVAAGVRWAVEAAMAVVAAGVGVAGGWAGTGATDVLRHSRGCGGGRGGETWWV